MRSTAARLALPAAVAIVALLAVVAGAPAQAQAQAADNGTTTFTFDVQADGDARVSVTLQLALEDDTDRTAFDRLASDHNNGADSPLSVGPFERAAEQASESTGRSMEIRSVSRTASRTNETGRLTLRFTWTNFASVSGDRLLVNDAFRTPDGTWMPGLAENQELVISFPAGYSPQSIDTPGARYQLVNGTVVVEGPATFGPGTPEVVMLQTGGSIPIPRVLIAAAVVLAALLALLAYYFRGPLRSFVRRDSGEETIVEGETTNPDDDDIDPMAEPLLSDEERVLKLLESRDGRMKQVEIVEATDWSNAKVSQLLSEMDDAGRVDKLRIGRENLISLPGRGPGSE